MSKQEDFQNRALAYLLRERGVEADYEQRRGRQQIDDAVINTLDLDSWVASLPACGENWRGNRRLWTGDAGTSLQTEAISRKAGELSSGWPRLVS